MRSPKNATSPDAAAIGGRSDTWEAPAQTSLRHKLIYLTDTSHFRITNPTKHRGRVEEEGLEEEGVEEAQHQGVEETEHLPPFGQP